MDTQYLCEMYFDSEKSKLKDLMTNSLDCLGFVPKRMTIYASMNKMFEDVPFDNDLIFATLSEDPEASITVRPAARDCGFQPLWFKFGGLENKFVPLRWSNTNLDFLLSTKILYYLKSYGFTACYAFDNADAWEQSRLAKENKEMDYATYPGQFKHVCGMQFMAAPIMWFGEPFFDIIGKDALILFNKACVNEEIAAKVVQIKLFDIYESADKQENREEQKKFWQFFDLGKAIYKFEDEHTIDAAEALKIFIKKHSR